MPGNIFDMDCDVHANNCFVIVGSGDVVVSENAFASSKKILKLKYSAKICKFCKNCFNVQWGSDYQTSEVLGLKRGWMTNGPVFECHMNIGQPDHLNTGQMDAILFSDELVQYPNGRFSR